MIDRDEQITLAEHAMADEEYERARQLLSRLLQNNAHDEMALLLDARCRLALNEGDKAMENYRFILKMEKMFSLNARLEALLALGRDAEVLQLLQNSTTEPDHLLAALAFYLHGRIRDCQRQLEQFIRDGGEWQDEDAISPLILHLLSRPEFLDFEQMYLDMVENYGRSTPKAQNRWFALNMPIYELFTASDAQKRRHRAIALAKLLLPTEEISLENSREWLRQTLQDFAASQEDASFGLESLKQYDEGRLDVVAKNILSLELEHLAQFSELIGLTPADVRESQLQQLIVLLPYRIALCLMLLYTLSEFQDRLQQSMQQNLENELMVALIFLAFKAFYQEFDYIKSRRG